MRYAARRMQAQTLTWSSQLQALAKDGNNLTPGQQANLQQGISAAIDAMTGLRTALDVSLPAAECPPRLKSALDSAGVQLNAVGRDVIPPWTRQNHAQQVGAISTTLFNFRKEVGCPLFPSSGPPPLPLPPPLSRRYSGVIGGHTVSAANGHPIAGADVELRGIIIGRTSRRWTEAEEKESNDVSSIQRQVVSGPSGAWSFTGLPPGCYWLWASSGNRLPVSQFVSLSPATPADCAVGRNFIVRPSPLPAVPAAPGVNLRFENSGVTTMPYGALVAAYPFDQAYLQIRDAQLSHDAGRLALFINDDVWVYTLKNQSMQKVASLKPGNCGVGQLLMAWSGSDLILSRQGGCVHTWKDYRIADGLGPPVEIPQIKSWPPGGQGRFERVPHTSSTAAATGPFSLWIARYGKLFLAQNGEPPRLIAPTALSISSAILDRQRQQVFYVDDGQDALDVYNLRTAKIRSRPLPGQVRTPLTAARLPNATLFAYTADGGCGAHQPGTPFQPGRRVCLVEIPDAETH